MPSLSTLYDKFIRRATLTTQDKADILGDIGGQPLDSDLTAIAALATTSFGRSGLTDDDQNMARTRIGACAADGSVISDLIGQRSTIGLTGSISGFGTISYGDNAFSFIETDEPNGVPTGRGVIVEPSGNFTMGLATEPLTAHRVYIFPNIGGSVPIVPAYADITSANAALAAGDFFWDTTLKKLRTATA